MLEIITARDFYDITVKNTNDETYNVILNTIKNLFQSDDYCQKYADSTGIYGLRGNDFVSIQKQEEVVIFRSTSKGINTFFVEFVNELNSIGSNG